MTAICKECEIHCFDAEVMMSSPSAGTNNSILESKIGNIDSRVNRPEENNIQLEEKNIQLEEEIKVIQDDN